MSDMPERIIARVDYDGEWDGQWCEPGREPIGIHAYHHAEYVQADRIEALEAENARLRKALRRIEASTDTKEQGAIATATLAALDAEK